MIYESLGTVWAIESMLTRHSSSLINSEPLGAVWVSKPWVTFDTSSLMFYESLGAVWAVESVRHP